MGLTRRETYSTKHSSAGRRWGFNRIYGDGPDGKRTIYMTRFWLGRLRFHLFHRGDADPDCHDHPWAFWTFPLRSYVEEVLVERVETHHGALLEPAIGFDWNTGLGLAEDVLTRTYFERELRIVRAFRLHYRPATHRHRVLGAYLGPRPKNDDRLYAEGRALYPGELYREGLIPTIVWRELVSRHWGFTKERNGKWCWVPWITYVYEGGKNAPCE